MQFELREKNSSKVYYTGSKWKNKTGDIVVLGQINKPVVKSLTETIYPYFLVEFTNGYKKQVLNSSIYRGNIINPFYPTVCGIGYHGADGLSTENNGKRSRKYNLWHGMITRCYNEKMRQWFKAGL